MINPTVRGKAGPMFQATAIHYDIEAIRDALESVEGLFDERGQLGVTARAGADKPLYDALGWLPRGAREADYCVIAEQFQGTAIADLLSKLPFAYGRTRLIKMEPKTCIAAHADPTARYHYAIVTNPDCYLIDVDGSSGTFYHIPADGRLYHMKAFRPHTGFNAGTTTRTHLVICGVDDEPNVTMGPVKLTGVALG